VVVEPLVRNIDVWPTLLALLGLPPLPEADGRSLVPMIQAAARGEAPPVWSPAAPEAIAYLDLAWARPSKESDPLVSVRQGSHRLLYRTSFPEKAELYDHAVDPWEQVNLAEQEPDNVARLRAKIEPQLSEEPPWGAAPETPLDELQLNQLRALGYVDDAQP
jgi:arylsulfatase A-like enzyme